MVARRPASAFGGLDVAVDEPGPVGGVERVGDLRHDPRRPLRGKWALAPDEASPVVARDIAHHQIRNAALLARLVDRDHVRVVDRGREPRLLHETAPRSLVLHQLGSDDLQRHRPLEIELGGATMGGDTMPPRPITASIR